jgi:hypothetical protein
LTAVLKCRNQFDLALIDKAIEEQLAIQRREASIRPVGQKNPYQSPFAYSDRQKVDNPRDSN